MAPNPYKAISVTNTETNDDFAAGIERALNKLDTEGYRPEPGFIFRNGHHVVLVGKRKLSRSSKKSQ